MCWPIFADGLLRGMEICDDGNIQNDDGCSGTGEIEQGWLCDTFLEPTVCHPEQGDGLLRGNEVCDDGNFDDGDGCSQSGGIEQGWYCDRLSELDVFYNYG